MGSKTEVAEFQPDAMNRGGVVDRLFRAMSRDWKMKGHFNDSKLEGDHLEL